MMPIQGKNTFRIGDTAHDPGAPRRRIEPDVDRKPHDHVAPLPRRREHLTVALPPIAVTHSEVFHPDQTLRRAFDARAASQH